MRFEQIEMLVKVSELHSMQKAADELHTTIQNVSKSLKSLEAELDVPLFLRTKKGVFLTADGEFVYNEAKIILEHSSIIQNKYSGKIEDLKQLNTLNILCCGALSTNVSTTVKKMRNKNPQLAISNIVIDPLKAINEILNETALIQEQHIIITSLLATDLPAIMTKSNNYEISLLRTDYVGIHCNKDHIFANYNTVPLKLLSTTSSLIDVCQLPEGSYLYNLVKRQGINLNKSLIVNSSEQCTQYIVDNFGYSLVPIYTDMPENIFNENTVIRPLKEKIELNYVLLIPLKFQELLEIKIFKKIFLKNFKNTYKRLT